MNLKININKTKYIQFQSYKADHNNLMISYSNSNVEEVNASKILGLNIDKHLNWKLHIQCLNKKLEHIAIHYR